MITGAAARAGEPAGDTLHHQIVVDLQLDHRIELHRRTGEHRIEGFGLWRRARKAVKDETPRAIRLRDAGCQHADDDIIGDEFARLHHLLGLKPDRRPGGDLGAEHIAGRDLGDAVRVLKTAGLRALPGPRGPQQN